MARLLTEKFKVPPDVIDLEKDSTNTIENVARAITRLEEQGLPKNEFLTVSNGYHMDRITEIMKKFGLTSQPISAEQALNQRAREHAQKMRIKEESRGLDKKEVERRYQIRVNRYDTVIQRLYRTNEVIQNEMQNENKWLNAMKDMPGFWLPQVLAIRGEKLKEIVETNRQDIKSWLERHPEIGVTVGDLIEGNFDFRELLKGREVPQ